MKMFVEPPAIYLYKQPVDFRKSINGLSAIVEAEMDRSPFSGAVFVFCNRQRDKVRALYWDKTGFCLWYKRLEKNKFKWPRKVKGDVWTSQSLLDTFDSYNVTQTRGVYEQRQTVYRRV